MEVRASLQITCFSPAGIEGIKKALRAAKAQGEDEHQISARVLSSPEYTLSTTNKDASAGISLLQQAIEAAKSSIAQDGGNLVVKAEPKAVEERDNKELQEAMERADRANREVAADDSNEEDSEA